MNWTAPLSGRFDWRCAQLADRHYSRQKPGSPQFVPPSSCVVLLTLDEQAVWSSIRQRFVRHAWPDAWICSIFRNEGPVLSSLLIREAIAVTRFAWGEPTSAGMVTFVDAEKVRHKRDPGRCFLKAGFKRVGETKSGLIALQLSPENFPLPERPVMPLFAWRVA